MATLRRLELPPPRTLANANRASLKVNIRNAQPTKLPCAHSRFRRQPVNQIVHQVLRWHFGVRKPGILKESRSSTPAFGPRLLCDITPDDIAAYQRRRLQSGVENRTVNLEVGELRKVLKANDAWLPLVGKYKRLKERADVGIALSPEQERALLQGTAGTDSACHTATILALNTTMRSSEIKQLRWLQVDLEKRVLTVGQSKTDAGEGRPIPLNVVVFEALVRWAGRFPNARPEHYVFPWCENRRIDPSRPTEGWRTAWRNALKRAGFRCRFHDLRHTEISKLAQASDMTIMAIAGHVSKKMLEHYSHIRMVAKRAAVDALVQVPERPVFEGSVHLLQVGVLDASSKSLN